MNKILLDCDGVLLNWVDPFVSWMQLEHDRIPDYNKMQQSYHISHWYNITASEELYYVKAFNSLQLELQALPHSFNFIRELIRRKYHIHFVTACGYDNTDHRINNLKQVFNLRTNQFILNSVAENESKVDIFKTFKNSNIIYVEDDPSHAISAQSYNLTPIILNTLHNRRIDVNESIIRVNSLYSILPKL